MSSDVKMPLAKAVALAQRIQKQLTTACERIQIAGSIRREKDLVGDIEIVAIPKRDGFYEEPTLLNRKLQAFVNDWKLHRIKDGEKYKQFTIIQANCNLDLFLCEPETWGLGLTIRTGPESFSKRIVTQQFKGGDLPNDLRVQDLRLWRGDEALPTPEEEDFFRLAEITWIPPPNRR